MDAAQLDHLVVVADTLEQGAAWCEATLGVVPAPGGRHPLMGTHNRLLKIAGPGHARAYLEIIAIDRDAAPPAHARWFGMDDPALQQAVRREPRLVHWVASVPDLAGACAAWAAMGLDPGTPRAASRDTPRGRLEWQITVRDDGRPQCGGALPTLIQWGQAHPSQSLPDSGVRLQSLALAAQPPGRLVQACAAIGWSGMTVRPEGPALQAALYTPRGDVLLAGGFLA
jgi:hypothetical protein